MNKITNYKMWRKVKLGGRMAEQWYREYLHSVVIVYDY